MQIVHFPLSSHRVLRGQTSCTNSDSWHLCGGDLCALFHLRVASVYGDVTSLDCGVAEMRRGTGERRLPTCAAPALEVDFKGPGRGPGTCLPTPRKALDGKEKCGTQRLRVCVAACCPSESFFHVAQSSKTRANDCDRRSMPRREGGGSW